MHRNSPPEEALSKKPEEWQEFNRQYLAAALGPVRERLRGHIDGRGPVEPAPPENQPEETALERLRQGFRLSAFERDVLLLSAGVELDSDLARLCGEALGKGETAFPTFSLALALFPNAHWSALSPASPLRYWKLIRLESGRSLTRSPLQIDERILHYLTGVTYLDERLADLVSPVLGAVDLVASHREHARRIVGLWAQARTSGVVPLIQLVGADLLMKRSIAVAACRATRLNVMVAGANALGEHAQDLGAVVRLWERESTLNGYALLLEADDAGREEPGHTVTVRRLLEQTRGPLLYSTRERQQPVQRLTVTIDVDKPTLGEQRDLWNRALSGMLPDHEAQSEMLVAQFNLSPHTLLAAATEAAGRLSAPDETGPALVVWESCRNQVRPRLDDLALRIEPAAGWEDLVLPEAQMDTLREMSAHVRQRTHVYLYWGFASKGRRGLGISALFSGTSGTGKTTAAEVIARDLHLDLYRVDLSSVVSKYIGETEKNLRRIFDAAEEGGVLLLFDEADALFGKRSEVKDSHDRYANIEVSYLLQRMEAYRGLAILTTNQKSALDTAFLRRLRFIVHFPFPDAAQRAEIWRRIFPAATPRQGLDLEKLSRLNVSGGNIRNIALNAAFLAADAGEAVQMKHILRAARTEYGKLEKTLTDAETEGWVGRES